MYDLTDQYDSVAVWYAAAQKMRMKKITPEGYNPKVDLVRFGRDENVSSIFNLNLQNLTMQNTNFRTIVFTDKQQQIVVMSMPSGSQVGEHLHTKSAQFVYFEQGEGTVTIDKKMVQINPGLALHIPSNTLHNITAKTQLKLFTIYSPPIYAWDEIQPQPQQK
jgi:mannose-6-phosphate isomerase-like protein (cupin superfamily)